MRHWIMLVSIQRHVQQLGFHVLLSAALPALSSIALKPGILPSHITMRLVHLPGMFGNE